MNTITHVNPNELHSNPVFSQGTITETGRTLYVGGQNGTDSTGSIIAGGAGEQTAQALRNVLAVLADAGASQQDVAKLTVYLAVDADFNAAFGAVAQVWGPYPTAVTVLRINPAKEGALIEIEAVAALPTKG
ncbi:RidA family protein [Lysinibacter cavernae]|uniref:Enamine deaminase RidA (YjgF/YER057c/UK114 family) n=1 Tax=Lysinibacter cavernae TaxID=1640652 RepID=A0A7X5QYH7_9MICO|nr:RidA family protein [Lysinibacter cavernae]NIH52287.1 enamine deaminase RidA (YjgF/YER057c/UK114 family) [Lysinibacter cavernae]